MRKFSVKLVATPGLEEVEGCEWNDRELAEISRLGKPNHRNTRIDALDRWLAG